MNPRHLKTGMGLLLAVMMLALVLTPVPSRAEDLPDYLSDRGRGVQGSLFGTFIEEDDFLLYIYYEYYHDDDEEYSPSDFGINDNEDYFGKGIEHEFLIFLGYGLTEDIALEFEAAYYTSKTLQKDPDDPSAMPGSIEESGLGDVESQIRWRWKDETESSPELFSFFEVVFPFQKNKDIIGTKDWEFALGFGAIKGFGWGTLTGRTAVAYSAEEEEFEVGEYAVDYLKRLSEDWRLVLSIEGEDDEVEFITESQHALSESATLKLNLGLGVTKKATDFAPEIGVMWKL